MATTLSDPVKVLYCAQCGMPPEYCEFGPDFKTHCKPWLLKAHPEVCARLHGGGTKGEKAAAAAVTAAAAAAVTAAPSDAGPATKAKAAVVVATAPWTMKERLTNFYAKYDAAKVSEVDVLLAKYKGKEEPLFLALVKKYGKEPLDPYLKFKYGLTEEDDDSDDDGGDDDDDDEDDDEDDGKKKQAGKAPAAAAKAPAAAAKAPAALPSPSAVPATAPWTMKERLTNFYAKYDAAKVSEVDVLLAKYKGKEEPLFLALVKKYGKEPLDPYLKFKYGLTEEDDDNDDGDNDGDDSSDEEEETSVDKTTKAVGALKIAQDAAKAKVKAAAGGGAAAAAEDGEDDEDDEDDEEEKEEVATKNKDARGASAKTSKKVDTRVVIAKDQRNKKKAITVVIGLDTVPDVKLKECAKAFAKRFAGASSVKEREGGGQEVIIQGDHMEEVARMIIEKFKVKKNCVFLDIDGAFVAID